MATPDEMKLLLHLGEGHEPDDKSLKEHMIEALAGREGAAGSTVRCEWCGQTYRKKRASQKFCMPECQTEFQMYAKRVLRSLK